MSINIEQIYNELEKFCTKNYKDILEVDGNDESSIIVIMFMRKTNNVDDFIDAVYECAKYITKENHQVQVSIHEYGVYNYEFYGELRLLDI